MKIHTLDTIVNIVKSIIRLPRARKRGRPFIYSIKTVAVFFYTMILKGITCFKTMRKSLMNNPAFANICGFKDRLPNRTTLSRRFKGLYGLLKDQMRHMGDLLTKKEVTAPYMCSVDSTMHKAHGNIWHKKHKKIGYMPPKLRSIDKDADWGKSEYKGWVYGYKTHIISTSSFHKLSVPLYCEVTPANHSDCPTAKGIFKQFWPRKIKYLLADKGYDDKTLRAVCHKAKALLITPMRRHKHMHPERKIWLKFYKSRMGKKRYSQRSKTIEPLIGHIKDVFNTEKLKVKGLQNAQSFLLLCVWIYQTLIYYNFLYQRPLKRIKDLVCAI